MHSSMQFNFVGLACLCIEPGGQAPENGNDCWVKVVTRLAFNDNHDFV